MNNNQNERKVVLITGASRGLGKSISEKLVLKGHKVYGGMRNPKKIILKPNFSSVYLNLLEDNSMETAVRKIINEEGKIDVLIHNAAIAYYSPVEAMTSKDVVELFQINFFGPHRLTNLVLPHMRKCNKGCLIFISSIRTIANCAFLGMYAASKAALEAMAFDLAMTVKRWNIRISIIQPGPMTTNMKLKSGGNKKIENLYLFPKDLTLQFQPVKEVSNLIVKTIENEKSDFRIPTSEYVKKEIGKHLRDVSGNKYLVDQLKSFENIL
jgi:NAD(P)-dependent dehydrogenase (short-subunit alcohol dehydrogenase family)